MPFDDDQRVRDWLGDIAEWAERCARHIAGLDYEAFVRDEKTRDAVSKCVEVVGTAAKSLLDKSPDIEARHPELELRRAYATRIRLAHAYRDIDPKVLWATALQSMPAIGQAARRVLAALRPDPED
jgi:uncharacterized protein with HEPN domain